MDTLCHCEGVHPTEAIYSFARLLRRRLKPRLLAMTLESRFSGNISVNISDHSPFDELRVTLSLSNGSAAKPAGQKRAAW
jgi:hypothetical protein